MICHRCGEYTPSEGRSLSCPHCRRSEPAPSRLSTGDREALEHARREMERLRVIDLSTSRGAYAHGRKESARELERAADRHSAAIATITRLLGEDA